MRETRTCGSEGGEAREGLSYPYCSPLVHTGASKHRLSSVNYRKHAKKTEFPILPLTLPVLATLSRAEIPDKLLHP